MAPPQNKCTACARLNTLGGPTGGGFVDELGKLAIPLGLIAAERGMRYMVDHKNKKSKEASKESKASKVSKASKESKESKASKASKESKAKALKFWG